MPSQVIVALLATLPSRCEGRASCSAGPLSSRFSRNVASDATPRRLDEGPEGVPQAMGMEIGDPEVVGDLRADIPGTARGEAVGSPCHLVAPRGGVERDEQGRRGVGAGREIVVDRVARPGGDRDDALLVPIPTPKSARLCICPLCPISAILVSDLDRPFCHP
jgi:hypothetical protein